MRCSWCGAQIDYYDDGSDGEFVTCSIMCWLALLDYAITHGAREIH